MTENRQVNADILPIKSLYFEEKNTVPCKASFPSSNGCISAHVDDIHLKLSIHAYFEVRLHTVLSKYENSKNGYL